MRLCHLVYYSRRTSANATDIENIFDTARRNNEKLNLTGALFVSDDHFVQVLEGPHDVLLTLFIKIMEDPRHTEVVLNLVDEIRYRMFKCWTMAELNNSNPHIAEIFEKYRVDPGLQSMPSGVTMWEMLDAMAQAVLRPPNLF